MPHVSIRALPAEGDRRPWRIGRKCPCVSIRALPAEGDGPRSSPRTARASFNPRPPCGGRLTCLGRVAYRPPFQSAPSLRRATTRRRRGIWPGPRFNPRPPCGGRHRERGMPALVATPFQSAPSLRRATRRSRLFATFAWRFNPRPPCGGRPEADGVGVLV